MPDAIIGLGSNLGNRAGHLARAREALLDHVGPLLAASSIYDTDPWGPIPQDSYLNQVVVVSTGLSPADLLAALHAIERAAGRDRTNEVRYGPRTLDLDILFYGEATVSESGLDIPHPRIAERAFVLVPLAEIAPEIEIAGTPVASLLRRIDSSGVRRYDRL